MTVSQPKRTSHAVYDTHFHLVFVTKYRKRVFTDVILEDCETAMRKVCGKFGSDLEEFNGEADHVHIVVTLPPTVAISSLVNSLKGVSSRLLHRDHQEHVEKFLWNGHLWSRSYYAGTTGAATLESVKQYIKNQDRPKA